MMREGHDVAFLQRYEGYPITDRVEMRESRQDLLDSTWTGRRNSMQKSLFPTA